MATLVGLTVIKKFPYRGDSTEEYSNTYHLTGSVPSDAAAWKTLADALIAQEKTCYTGDTWTVRAYGYDSDADDATAVWSNDYEAAAATVPGTLAQGTGVLCPGDSAVWVRWKTSRMVNGRPVYLRKYFHPAVGLSGAGANRDVILPAQRTALLAFGSKMRDGTFADARTLRSRSTADTLLAHSASVYVGYRQLKRGRRRPTP